MVVSKSCENSFYKTKVMCILCLGHIGISLICVRKATKEASPLKGCVSVDLDLTTQ